MIVERLEKVLSQIIEHEENARQTLLEKKPKSVYNHIGRAYGILANAHSISSKETMNLLSLLRLGVDLGLFPGSDRSLVDELFLTTQPAHLQRQISDKLSAEERDLIRADMVRERLKNVSRRSLCRSRPTRRIDSCSQSAADWPCAAASGVDFCSRIFFCSRSSSIFSISGISGSAAFCVSAAIWRSKNWFRNFKTTSSSCLSGFGIFRSSAAASVTRFPHFRRIAFVQKRRHVLPRFALLGRQAPFDNLPRERIRKPVQIQMQRGPSRQFVMKQK